MWKSKALFPLAALLAMGMGLSAAGAAELSGYVAVDLYSPCHESDNDARWGAAAEAECEQYLRGFTDALVLAGMIGTDHNICLPEQNRDDEVRWAYMRWINENFGDRGMPAAEALMATLKDKFPCN